MKKVFYNSILFGVASCLAQITVSTKIDHPSCNFDILVMENTSTLFSETMHIPGEYKTTACWDSRATACHIKTDEENYIVGMKKNRATTFINSSGQICYFENLGFSTGNMGGFYSQPWSYVNSVSVKVGCEDSTSTPLYCAKTEKMATQVLLAKQEFACTEKGGSFKGGVYTFKQEDGSNEYCVSASCDICDTDYFDEQVNQWKESECCIKSRKEPNDGKATCVSIAV